MANTIYTGLARQAGLAREMAVIANNIANLSTTGFRREGVIFAEHIRRLGADPSLSMGRASARAVDLTEAEASPTGGAYDFAIRGPGFFLIETPEGERLTRAGHFTPNDAGDLVTPDGFRLLDDGGGPITVPPGAGAVALAPDGTLSADGQPVARIGLWQPADATTLRHTGGTRFSAGEVVPVEDGATLLQGHLEGANVDPVLEIARMIEVSRAYEAGQRLMDREDERIRAVIQITGR